MTRLEREALLLRLQRDARAVARRFGVAGVTVSLCHSAGQCARCDLGPDADPGPPNAGTCWGSCEGAQGDFRIRLRVFNRRNGRELDYQNIADTLVHELAHALTWGEDGDDHGVEWKRAYARMRGWAVAEEIIDEFRNK